MRTGREAAVFITRGGELLLMHRTREDYWHVAAGVVEEGESFAEAAARELRKETGLALEPTDLERSQSYAIPDELRHEYTPGVAEVTIGNFVVEAPLGWEPVLNEEHDAYRWLGVADAIALAHWPETFEIIATLAAPKREAR